ncbi:MAG: 23S rRNA (uracil(1939)-C(5))-methyltransferase RlmD [Erysipelotrichaceae bacterium]|nr:23S rRNA (uracil(1939)-C(5))-methyltransferase RlmD [Erysipelotrichaceae bacterium]
MKNYVVYLKCIDITNDGQGICKKDGLVIFVKEMLIDEEAEVKIIAEKKNLAYGIIDKLIVPSKYRQESLCPISYKCGGCDFLYVDYNYQLVLKKHILEQTFKNMDLNIKINDVIGADNPYEYRSKVQIPVNNHEFGFYRKYSNDIVEFDNCYIQSKLSNDIFKYLKEKLLNLRIDKYIRHILIKHCFGTNEVMLCLIVKDFNIPNIEELVNDIIIKFNDIKSFILNLNTRNDNVILGNEEKVLYGKNYVTDIFDGIKFNISLKSFYQVNYEQMRKLYYLAKDLADVNDQTKLLDLYCGIGTISLFMARFCKDVVGVEIVKEAIENAKLNAEINGIKNATFYLDDANNEMDKYLIDKDVVIVDPPRKGLNDKLINSLINSDIKKIVYISCNPATLARDLCKFEGYFSFDTVYPVDMFPNTKHVETVVLMSRVELVV